ncbi:MAG: UDP-N-acetylmuramate--L-alanine ligase [Gemmatimonadota bacterium]
MSARIDLRALAEERPVHFMGVGGAGMFPLAELLLRSGGRVSGCDAKESRALADLSALGGDVSVGHDPAHIDGAAALVLTAAVPLDHPEVQAAEAAGLPVLKRAEALGAWVAGGRVVGIAGTHGKTTTTAMATEVLAAADLDPTGLVGGRVAGWDGNLRFGRSDLFVVEADEYDRSFLTLAPDVAVVTNLEADHLDIYGDLDGVRRSFLDFLAGVRGGGRVIVCADDHGAAGLLPAIGAAGYTYGTTAGCMLRATDVRLDEDGTYATVWEDGERAGTMRIGLGGRHNLLNALAAAAVGRAVGAEWPDVFAGLRAFAGVGRRFETLGTSGGVLVIDDYAHHPTEVAAAIRAVRAMHPDRRLVAAFQPHLFSRTRDFAREFGEALALADVVYVTDVFPAREAPIEGVTGRTIADAVTAAGSRATHYVPALDELPAAVVGDAVFGDVVLTMGAGSIERAGTEILRLLEAPIHA